MKILNNHEYKNTSLEQMWLYKNIALISYSIKLTEYTLLWKNIVFAMNRI